MTEKKSKLLMMLQRAACAGVVGLMWMGPVQAQSADGALSVRVAARTWVEIVHTTTHEKHGAQADERGLVRFSGIRPGHYRVSTSTGDAQNVEVLLGVEGALVLAAEDVPDVHIEAERRGRLNVDMSNPMPSVVVRRQDTRALPIGASIEAVATRLATDTTTGDAHLGSGRLPAFGGASVGENGYYINGFDVTNIRNFLSYIEVPFEAIDQIQVKGGAFGAEYGRALGGVINVMTRSGHMSEWHGGASLAVEPRFLRARARDVHSRKSSSALDYTLYQSLDAQDSTTATAYFSGPIIEDRLSFFGLVQGNRAHVDDLEAATNTRSRSSSPSALLKLDWNLTPDHRLEWTGIHTRRQTQYTDYANAHLYSGSFDGVGQRSRSDGGSSVSIFRHVGTWSPALKTFWMVGQSKDQVDRVTGARMREGCPTVYDTNDQPIGCWSKIGLGPTLRDAGVPDDADQRRAWRFDVEYKAGAHLLRAGWDHERFRSVAAGQRYYGGTYYQYLTSEDGSVNGVPNVVNPGDPYVLQYVRTSTSGVYEVKNRAWYVEDTWAVVPERLTLYGGWRSESFDNQDARGRSFVKAHQLGAPRTGFVWNVDGKDQLRIYGAAGRYYIPVSSGTNIRLTRGETEWYSYHTYAGRNGVTQAPWGLSHAVGGETVIRDGRMPDPATVASTSLKPMAQDEFVLGFERALMPKWRMGVKGTYRTVRHGMDDFCAHYPMTRWAADNGYTQFDPATLSSCILINPGRDVTLKMDVDNNGQLQQVTIPAGYFGLATYRRTYQGLTFTLDRDFDDVWGMGFSYTWSRSVGTAEGYVQSSLNQGDAGSTQDFDSGSLTRGAHGYLPNDRRHQFKLHGWYAFNANYSMGLVGTLVSGRPISCMGYVPKSAFDHAEAQFAQPSSFYCLNDKGVPQLHRRGSMGRTPWSSQLDVKFGYTQKLTHGAFSLEAEIFNIFNQQSAIEVDEFGDATESVRSVNYGTPTAFSTPRYVRLTARYDF